jgi:hypothetical protein
LAAISAQPSLFLLFCRKFATIGIAFAAEILECGPRGGTKNSGKQRVGPLFRRCKLAKTKFAGRCLHMPNALSVADWMAMLLN